MTLTPSQTAAISAQGNVLVMAGAGTGKTRTLVERCLSCLTNGTPPASIDEILMVTFTEAAAAEMRQRIRIRFEEELQKSPANARWQEQLALFESAHIGTLHGFCLQLIREHFYLLEVDPLLSVLAEEESRLLAEEALDQVFQPHYTGQTKAAVAVQELLQSQGGSDRLLRSLLLRIHHYTQTLPDPAGWFQNELARFANPKPEQWETWLHNELAEFRERWLRSLEGQPVTNEVAQSCLAALKTLPVNPSRDQAASVLKSVPEFCGNCKRGKKSEWLDPLEDFCAETEFLFSICTIEGQRDPLVEDWDWVRRPMLTLLGLAQEFSQTYADAKRELGMADFHDLEQFALRLLWDVKTNRPTDIARQWREKLRFVFVDEYQDINAAQDRIIEALSREGEQSNRFLVGDVKQSIYRFRLANPRIFQRYMKIWQSPGGSVIALLENFRSREFILNFINSLFETVMHENLGGIEYDQSASLQFGASAERHLLGAKENPAAKPELHLRVKSAANQPSTPEDSSPGMAALLDLQETEKEARLAALRLRELKAQTFPVWDDDTKTFRPVQWKDMAILLRSPSNKAENYAKEFQRAGVPLRVERGGFYKTLEISDLLSLFQILDNPLQDIPLLAVLHSPLVGLGVNELATVRLAEKGPFWRTLLRWSESQAGRNNDARERPTSIGQPFAYNTPTPPVQESGAPQAASSSDHFATKVRLFLERFSRWRQLARRSSLSRCLETVLSETHYDSWLLTQPRGEMRHANVQRLLHLTQQFDQFQRQGLYRFLCFVEAQQLAEAEPDSATATDEDSVRLMSIHQSKGLEFPVVVIGDLAKPFNLLDLRGDVLLDEEYGLCPRVKPPHTGKTYPSLSLWLAQRRQKHELLGEELRLLYVAMTRARDKLILTGTLSKKKLERMQECGSVTALDPEAIAEGRSYADWIIMWFATHGTVVDQTAGETDLLKWHIHDDTILLDDTSEETEAIQPESKPDDRIGGGSPFPSDAAAWEKIGERLAWEYPFQFSTLRPAKTSVSRLRHWAIENAEGESDSIPSAPTAIIPRARTASSKPKSSNKISAVDLGTLHHFFLQQVSLEHIETTAELKAEANRLAATGAFSQAEADQLDFQAIADFWNSDLGKTIRQQGPGIRRELAFTARFSQTELDELLGRPFQPELANEFAVVQGVADLAVILPKEIWIVDFKTDSVPPQDLQERADSYAPQLTLYAKALSRIYQRPVTKSWLYFLMPGILVSVDAVHT